MLKANPRLKPLPKEDDIRCAPRVLVVDDSRMVRIFCAHNLHDNGIHCEQAENGPEALAMVGTKPFDLILTDWVMPGMTGLVTVPAPAAELGFAESQDHRLFRANH